MEIGPDGVEKHTALNNRGVFRRARVAPPQVELLARRLKWYATISGHNADAKQLLQLLQPRVAASTGSACASGFQEPSYVLMAIGLTEEEARSSIRFSIGATTTKEDAIFAAREIADAWSRLV